MKDSRIEDLFRYVDDFLILCSTEVENLKKGCHDYVMRCFIQSCSGLNFTHELPEGKTTQFLDLA